MKRVRHWCALAVAIAVGCAVHGARAQVRQLTSNTVDDRPLDGTPGRLGRLFAQCGPSSLCLLPDLSPLRAAGARGLRAAGARALLIATGDSFPGDAIAGTLVTAIAFGPNVRPILVNDESWTTASDGSCAPTTTRRALDDFGAREREFGGMSLVVAERRNACGSPCPSAREVVLTDGIVTHRLTFGCGADGLVGFTGADHALWAATLRDTSATRCVVAFDATELESAPAGGSCPEARGYLDGTGLVWSPSGGLEVLPAGQSLLIPLPFLADEDSAAAYSRLLHGGLVAAQVPLRSDPTVARTLLFDSTGSRYVLDESAVPPRLPADVAASRSGYVLWIKHVVPSTGSAVISEPHLWRAGVDAVVPPFQFARIASPTVAENGAIAFAGVELEEGRRLDPDPELDIFASAAGTVRRVTLNGYEDDAPVYDGATLYWVGRPPNPGGERADWEIFAGGPTPPVCVEDGHGHRLAEVLVEYTAPGAPAVSTVADADGCLEGIDRAAGGTLRVRLQDQRNLVRVFHATRGTDADIVYFDAPVSATVTPLALTATNVSIPPRADELAEIYHHTQRAARYALETLYDPRSIVAIDPTGARRPVLAPVDVVGFDLTGGTRYSPSPPTILISHEDSLSHLPDNNEWHEYGHHVMASSVMGGGAGLPPRGGCARNHAGLYNGSSSDSFVEGWAVYFSSIVSAEVDADPLPELYTVSPAWTIDLDARWIATLACGGHEDIAVAAAMWDGYRLGVPLRQAWIALNRAACSTSACVHAELAAPTVLGQGLADWAFVRHGLYQDDGDFTWTLGERVGTAAFSLAFATTFDVDGDRSLACMPLPAAPAGCAAQASGLVARDGAGLGLMGTLDPAAAASSVCSHGALRPIHFRDGAGMGDVHTTTCGGAAPPSGGGLDESRILVLGEPARQHMPMDGRDATELSLVDQATGAPLGEGRLDYVVTCLGADVALSHAGGGHIEGLPRPVVIGVPPGACEVSIAATAPGHDASAPLVVTAADVLDGTAPLSHTFVLPARAAAAALAATASATVADGTVPLSTTLGVAIAGGVAPYDVRWVAGDGASLAGEHVAHVYGEPGTFTATARVADGMGTDVVTSVTITVRAATADGGDAGPSGDGGRASPAAPGCGCRAAPPSAPWPPLAVLALLAVALTRVRRPRLRGGLRYGRA